MVSLFFAEDDEVHITLYPREDHSKNLIVGGKLNEGLKNYQLILLEKFLDELESYSDSLMILFAEGKEMSEEWNVLQEKLMKTSDQDVRKKI